MSPAILSTNMEKEESKDGMIFFSLSKNILRFF